MDLKLGTWKWKGAGLIIAICESINGF